jgi:glycosyltransferase involved in cell wall biosynthesis
VNHEGQLPHSGLLIVIDDGSNDGTAAILDQLTASRKDTRLIRQENRGKGAALRAGIPHITGDITVIEDTDLEYDPAELPTLIAPIV